MRRPGYTIGSEAPGLGIEEKIMYSCGTCRREVDPANDDVVAGARLTPTPDLSSATTKPIETDHQLFHAQCFPRTASWHRVGKPKGL